MEDEKITTPADEVEESTLVADAGVDAEGTPATPSQEQGDATEDWKAKFEELNSKLQATIDRYERDIAGVKSSLQKNTAEERKKWEQEKADLERRLQDTQMAGMSESDRKAYQEQLSQQRVHQIEEENARLRNQMTEQQQRQSYTQWFINAGVPITELVVAGSVQELVDSGWNALKKQKDDLQMKLSKVEGSKTKPSQTPPSVIQPQGGAPITGQQWPALIKQYGSQEKVYELVEQGVLDPDVIPK